MSTLLIDELYSGVVFTQTISIETNQVLAHIRPWIFKSGTLADGDFRLQVYDGATLLKQVDIPYTSINAEFTEAYAHGYIRFDVEPLFLGVNDDESSHIYTLKFSMVNYTNDTSNYIAICRDWNDPKYQIYNGPPANDSLAPAGIELYTYRK
jgi:hypothetical protein